MKSVKAGRKGPYRSRWKIRVSIADGLKQLGFIMYIYVLRIMSIPDVDPFSQIDVFKNVLDICLNVDMSYDNELLLKEWDSDSGISSEIVLNDIHGRPSIIIRKWPL